VRLLSKARNSFEHIKLVVGRATLWCGNRIYLATALFALFFLIADSLAGTNFRKLNAGFFDILVNLRPTAPSPDSRIIIVDIDEGSLAEMAKHNGRWPWPNHVFASLLDDLHEAKPAAVVFDIFFSDKDTANPKSDQLFDDAVRKTEGIFPVYFPMVRLSSANDSKSQIPTEAVPGARQIGPASDSTIALILPQVPSALDQGNLAFLNVYPDRDGIVRSYPTRLDHAGWRFDSYGLKVARQLGYADALLDRSSFLINWRGPAFTFEYVSFKDVFAVNDVDKLTKLFSGKILIIGSTAPALQDLKATPVGSPFPGIEILATSIDNLANEDFILTTSPWVSSICGTIFIGYLTYMFLLAYKPDEINLYFLAGQGLLIGTAWVMLSFFNLFLDFSGVVTYAALVFTLSKVVNLQLRPLAKIARLKEFVPLMDQTAILFSAKIAGLSANDLRYFIERFTTRAQNQGWIVIPVLEPEGELGTFSVGFRSVLGFLCWPVNGSLSDNSELFEVAVMVVREVFLRELKRTSDSGVLEVAEFERFVIETCQLASSGELLGPVAYGAVITQLRSKGVL